MIQCCIWPPELLEHALWVATQLAAKAGDVVCRLGNCIPPVMETRFTLDASQWLTI